MLLDFSYEKRWSQEPSENQCFASKLLVTLKAFGAQTAACRVLKLSPSRSDAGTKCPMLVHYSYGRQSKTSAVQGASIKLHSCFHAVYVFPDHYTGITAIQTQV